MGARNTRKGLVHVRAVATFLQGSQDLAEGALGVSAGPRHDVLL